MEIQTVFEVTEPLRGETVTEPLMVEKPKLLKDTEDKTVALVLVMVSVDVHGCCTRNTEFATVFVGGLLVYVTQPPDQEDKPLHV
jgi:hypothetical protein